VRGLGGRLPTPGPRFAQGRVSSGSRGPLTPGPSPDGRAVANKIRTFSLTAYAGRGIVGHNGESGRRGSRPRPDAFPINSNPRSAGGPSSWPSPTRENPHPLPLSRRERGVEQKENFSLDRLRRSWHSLTQWRKWAARKPAPSFPTSRSNRTGARRAGPLPQGENPHPLPLSRREKGVEQKENFCLTAYAGRGIV